MKETIFNSEIMASLKAAGLWAYKVADSPTSWTMSRTRFTPEKPCDILACGSGGRFIAIEGKQMKTFKAFGLYALRPSQISNLDRIIERGGRAYVFLNVRIRARKGEVDHENRLIVFDWAKWGLLLPILPLTGREVRQLPFVSGRKGIFDLRSLRL